MNCAVKYILLLGCCMAQADSYNDQQLRRMCASFAMENKALRKRVDTLSARLELLENKHASGRSGKDNQAIETFRAHDWHMLVAIVGLVFIFAPQENGSLQEMARQGSN